MLLQLLATVDNWLRICDEGGEIGGLFFDIQKAFDLVPHEALMAKLQQAGLNSNILGNYLTCRRKTVAVNGSSSSDSPVLSGVLGAPRINSSATSFSHLH